MKKKLLIIRKSSDMFGGIESQVLKIAKFLLDSGNYLPILATSSLKSKFAESFNNLGLQVIEIPDLSKNPFKAAATLVKFIKKENVDIIQSHMFRESIVARIVKFRQPTIKHVFRVHTYIDCSFIPGYKKLLYHILDKCTVKWVDKFVSIGKFNMIEMEKKSLINKNKLELIPNGVEYIGEPDNLEENPESLMPKKIAIIANVIPHKGHDVLIKALGYAKERGIRINARLIGRHQSIQEDCYIKYLYSLAEDFGVKDQLEFYGFTTEIKASLENIDVVVLPSDSEGLPNCILEAMSLKKLVICSITGAIPEIITDRQNGLLHKVQDHETLGQILVEVFSKQKHCWNDIRLNGYLTWKNDFQIEKVLIDLQELHARLQVL